MKVHEEIVFYLKDTDMVMVGSWPFNLAAVVMLVKIAMVREGECYNTTFIFV